MDAATVELFMEALQRLTLHTYERDADGYCNIDAVTSRLLIPAPWVRAGYRRWGLRPTESAILRELVQRRQLGRDGRPPGLWLYDRTRRGWQLNLYDYDIPADGQKYWQRWPLTVTEYRRHVAKG